VEHDLSFHHLEDQFKAVLTSARQLLSALLHIAQHSTITNRQLHNQTNWFSQEPESKYLTIPFDYTGLISDNDAYNSTPASEVASLSVPGSHSTCRYCQQNIINQSELVLHNHYYNSLAVRVGSNAEILQNLTPDIKIIR